MFKLMVVTDRTRSTRPIVETVRMALAGGADAVQLREREISSRELYELATQLRVVTREAGAKLIVNGRLDVAIAAQADGVHLGWRSMAIKDARKVAGDKLIVGISCHNEAQLRSAQEAGADYILLGPVFATPSKEGLVQPLGVETLKRLVAVARKPVIAIGGINPQNVAQVLGAGVVGVAAISSIISAEDPHAAAQAMRAMG